MSKEFKVTSATVVFDVPSFSTKMMNFFSGGIHPWLIGFKVHNNDGHMADRSTSPVKRSSPSQVSPFDHFFSGRCSVISFDVVDRSRGRCVQRVYEEHVVSGLEKFSAQRPEAFLLLATGQEIEDRLMSEAMQFIVFGDVQYR